MLWKLHFIFSHRTIILSLHISLQPIRRRFHATGKPKIDEDNAHINVVGWHYRVDAGHMVSSFAEMYWGVLVAKYLYTAHHHLGRRRVCFVDLISGGDTTYFLLSCSYTAPRPKSVRLIITSISRRHDEVLHFPSGKSGAINHHNRSLYFHHNIIVTIIAWSRTYTISYGMKHQSANT